MLSPDARSVIDDVCDLGDLRSTGDCKPEGGFVIVDDLQPPVESLGNCPICKTPFERNDKGEVICPVRPFCKVD